MRMTQGTRTGGMQCGLVWRDPRGRAGFSYRLAALAHTPRRWRDGCWDIPGDPARDAIAASDGLDGRDRLGSGGIFGHK